MTAGASGFYMSTISALTAAAAAAAGGGGSGIALGGWVDKYLTGCAWFAIHRLLMVCA